jgi:intron-binding protein aquarius
MAAKPAPHRNGTVPVMAPSKNEHSSSSGSGSRKDAGKQGGGLLQASLRPTVEDLQGDNHYAQLARKTWLEKKKPAKVNAKVVKEELWEHLEQDGFKYTDLLILETLQAVEKWVAFIHYK